MSFIFLLDLAATGRDGPNLSKACGPDLEIAHVSVGFHKD